MSIYLTTESAIVAYQNATISLEQFMLLMPHVETIENQTAEIAEMKRLIVVMANSYTGFIELMSEGPDRSAIEKIVGEGKPHD